jgi:hypothetical protein
MQVSVPTTWRADPAGEERIVVFSIATSLVG